MKVIDIGKRGPYDEISYTESKKPNKYGVLFYLNERIYLVKNACEANYSIWSSDARVVHLVLTDAALQEEIRLICEMIKKKDESLEFKLSNPDDRIYLKINKDVEKIPMNCELTYCISVYGFFKQSATGKVFLQMDVKEARTTKISILEK